MLTNQKIDIDWQDSYYRTAQVTSHDLAVSGGTEKSSYNFGAGYYKDQAVLPGQDYTRYSVRASLDQEIGKYFRFVSLQTITLLLIMVVI